MPTFKKDYINYVLHSIKKSYPHKTPEEMRVINIVDRIIQSDDLVKITFIIGKTAGLDILFKYLIYISDKIDKSKVSVSNLKGNFDYDTENLKKIFDKMQLYKSPAVLEKIEIPAAVDGTEEKGSEEAGEEQPETEVYTSDLNAEGNREDTIKSDEQTDTEYSAPEEEAAGLELVENEEGTDGSEEVFELPDLNDNKQEPTEVEQTSEVPLPPAVSPSDFQKGEISIPDESELEIEISRGGEQTAPAEESVTNEVYNKFEVKFYEEVKILEKLFIRIYNETKTGKITKVTEKLLESFSEIIEISSELSDLSRQLSFDLTADIFLTINLCFTRGLNNPDIITEERISLLSSSLSLVNSIIRGGNYLNYDIILEKIETLKNEMLRHDEQAKEKTTPDSGVSDEVKPQAEKEVSKKSGQYTASALRSQEADTAIFKMKWVVKNFEKVFLGLDKITGEYSKFEAIEKIDELNNYLRMIAKLASSVKATEVSKLSEVSYVFLKYIKDYRIDLLDPEIQQIIKYMIFTFKMLLTNRIPEDLGVLVQYLNNPVKIFTDT